MTGRRSNTAQARIAVEDILLTILGLGAGPLLWWMGQLWQQLPTASSTQTLEYWIALICGLLGGALCVMWTVFLLAGLALVVGLKTRSTVLTYWAEVFTPKLLRRLIIAILGTQLAVTSQAVAAPHAEETLSPTPVEQQEPFMPYVHDPSTHSPEVTATSTSSPSTRPTTPSPSRTAATPSSRTPTASPTPTPEPRQQSEVTVNPEPNVPAETAKTLTPTPRHTSTVEVEDGPRANAHSAAPEPGENFVPQQPVPSPYIAAPNQSRTNEDPTVVVKAGDCLWDIAYHELGADATLFQIDQRWRQWWRYNQNTIGDNPHALQPGTVLQSPPFTE